MAGESVGQCGHSVVGLFDYVLICNVQWTPRYEEIPGGPSVPSTKEPTDHA
jgi:hypothetical protein